MWASNLASVLNRVVNPLALVNCYIGAMAMVAMVLWVVIDVTSRAILNKALQGSVDITGLLLVIVFFSGYAYAQVKGKHIQVDVLVERLTRTARQVVVTNGLLLTIGIAVILFWQFFRQAEFLRSGNVFTGALHIPEWPFLIVTAFFMIVFTLALLNSFLTELAELVHLQGIKSYLWLSLGIILALGLFVGSIWPYLLPFEIAKETWGLIIITLLFILIFLKVHIGACMALSSLFGLSYLVSADAGLTNLGMTSLRIAHTYTWSVVPLFMWMGLLIYYGKFARDLYDVAYKWIGQVPGGLASASVAACAGLSAVTGDGLTGVLSVSPVALPEMKAYRYDPKLSTGSICAASTIGVLIPPSLPFIIYGMLTRVSIGKLFIAGIFPGILFTLILVGMITLMCSMNPKLGPAGPRATWRERILSIKGVWGVALLILLVIGGLYTGTFTPTEAGAIGAFGALVIGTIRGGLKLRGFIDSTLEAIQLTSAIMFIFVFANALGVFLSITGLPYRLAEWITSLGLSAYGLISLILLIYVILGCLMNALPAVILTLPIFFPVVISAGFDPVWFGVLIVVMVQLGTVTPPIGMVVFAMAGIATDVPMYSIFKGVIPFWIAFLVLVIILVLFPQISLFLPNLM